MVEVPNANKYAAFADVSPEALNERFDGKRIARMNSLAKEKADKDAWLEESAIHLKAFRNGNYRDHVRDAFLTTCPFKDVVSAHKQGLGIKDALPVDEAANKHFDDRRIAFVLELSDKRALENEWQKEYCIHLNAARHGNLRDHVRDNFLRLCPHTKWTNALRTEVGMVDAAPDEALSAVAEALQVEATPAPAQHDDTVVSFADAASAKKQQRPGGKKARKAAKGGDQKTA